MGVPSGWPTVQRPSLRRVRWWRAGVAVAALFVMVAILFFALVMERQWWQWVVETASVAMSSAGLAGLWRLAPRPRSIAPVRWWSQPPKDTVIALRRALLHGEPIGADRLRDVAALAAGATRTRVTVALFASITGNSGLAVAKGLVGTERRLPSTMLPWVLFWFSVIGAAVWVAVVMPAMVVDLRRAVRIERAAGALGATPVVIDEAETR